MRAVAFNRLKKSIFMAVIVGSLGWMTAGVAPAAGTATADAFRVSTGKLMYQVLPHTTLHSVPLGNAIDYLRQVSGANIVVNWNALEAAGVSKQATVSLDLRYVTVKKTLELMLSQASSSATLVSYISGNVLTVTTQGDADTHLVTRVYQVGDLVMTIPNFTSFPQFNLQSATQNSTAQVSSTGGGGIGNAGGGGGLFGGGTSSGQSNIETPDQRGQDLVKLVEHTIQPNVWQSNGGQSNVSYFRGQLVVTAPVYVQQLIGG
ncbi:MAG: hypothetical protein HKL96_06615 [Phycisphaerales bacterium]|nr:hypothetical protein [Phycisphaerales bacterium]